MRSQEEGGGALSLLSPGDLVEQVWQRLQPHIWRYEASRVAEFPRTRCDS